MKKGQYIWSGIGGLFAGVRNWITKKHCTEKKKIGRSNGESKREVEHLLNRREGGGSRLAAGIEEETGGKTINPNVGGKRNEKRNCGNA